MNFSPKERKTFKMALTKKLLKDEDYSSFSNFLASAILNVLILGVHFIAWSYRVNA